MVVVVEANHLRVVLGRLTEEHIRTIRLVNWISRYFVKVSFCQHCNRWEGVLCTVR